MFERLAAKHITMRERINKLASTLSNLQQRDENMHKKTGLKTRCRKVNGPVVAPLLYVKRDKQGPQCQPKGQFTTNPHEIGGVVKRAWKIIYDGSCSQVTTMVEAFMKKYDKHIFKMEPFQVQEIGTDLVQEAFRKGKKSAAGMDSWEPGGFTLMSRYT